MKKGLSWYVLKIMSLGIIVEVNGLPGIVPEHIFDLWMTGGNKY